MTQIISLVFPFADVTVNGHFRIQFECERNFGCKPSRIHLAMENWPLNIKHDQEFHPLKMDLNKAKFEIADSLQNLESKFKCLEKELRKQKSNNIN